MPGADTNPVREQLDRLAKTARHAFDEHAAAVAETTEADKVQTAAHEELAQAQTRASNALTDFLSGKIDMDALLLAVRHQRNAGRRAHVAEQAYHDKNRIQNARADGLREARKVFGESLFEYLALMDGE